MLYFMLFNIKYLDIAIPKFSLFMLFLICGTLLMEILLGISGMWSGSDATIRTIRIIEYKRG